MDVFGLFLEGDREQCCKDYHCECVCVSGGTCVWVVRGVEQLSHCLRVSPSLPDSANWFLKWLCQFSFPPAVYEIILIGVDKHYNFCQPDQCFAVTHGGFTLHFPDVEHLLICVLAFWISSSERCFPKALSIFLLGFSFLADLDWKLRKNSGTLLGGQMPMDTPVWPNRKKIELSHLWGGQLCFLPQRVTEKNAVSITFLLLSFIWIELLPILWNCGDLTYGLAYSQFL